MNEQNDSKAAAYLRRSRIDEGRPGTVSYEAQEAAVRTMARRYGFDDPTILVDWGRSGGSDRKRPQFAQLRTLIETDRVGDVFAYDLSRLTRSLEDWVKLATLCRQHGARIHLSKEGTFDFSTASGEMLANILASVAQAVRRWASERSTETITSLRARGQTIGRKPYGSRPGEDLEAVKAAYVEAGSFYGAARQLNRRGLPTLKGKAWTHTSVAWILRQQAPELVTESSPGGLRRPGKFALSRLVRCHCGGLASPYTKVNGRNSDYRVYQCTRARNDSNHPHPYMVPEPLLLDWAKAEAALLRTPEIVQVAETRTAERAELDLRKARILDMFEAGHVTREEREARLAPIYEALERLDKEEALTALVNVPAIDWSWDPGKVNAVLRAMWDHIELDEQMRPVRAEWTVPEWRA